MSSREFKGKAFSLKKNNRDKYKAVELGMKKNQEKSKFHFVLVETYHYS